MLDLTKTKTIILDLGGVIININPSIAFENFAKLAQVPLEEVLLFLKTQDIFHRHEIGELSDEAFYLLINHKLAPVDYIDFVAAWNSLLLDIPVERIELIRKLGESYQLILLSNTNALHIEAISHYLTTTYDTNLDILFDKVYLSHQIGLRKPDKNIYEYVVQNAKIDAATSIFIDDVLINATSAEQVGITGIHLDLTKNTLVDIFN